jgi:hypothetical protein
MNELILFVYELSTCARPGSPLYSGLSCYSTDFNKKLSGGVPNLQFGSYKPVTLPNCKFGTPPDNALF